MSNTRIRPRLDATRRVHVTERKLANASRRTVAADESHVQNFEKIPLRDENGQGVAIMTNGDQGGSLANEIQEAVASEYRWPK